jgi:fucose 4-O-acetylase-like acetyltransferase
VGLRDSRRDLSLDIAKGIAILLVVLGHSLNGLLVSGFFPATLAWPVLALFMLSLFNVPLFFAVSGHLAAGKHRTAGATLARLLQKLVYPYLLWSVVAGLVLAWLGRFSATYPSLPALYQILWIPFSPYGFLYSLIFCHLGFLLIRRRSTPFKLVLAALVFLAPQFFVARLTAAHLLIVAETAHGFLYFVLGAVSVAQVKQFGRWMAISATMLFILFAIVFYQSQLSGAIAGPAALPAGIAGIVTILAWSQMLSRMLEESGGTAVARLGAWFGTGLAFCGRYSMGIFVLHIFFTGGVRIALRQLDFVPSLPAGLATFVEIAAAGTAGVLLPLGINWLASKFDIDKWLGLQHMETT